MRLSERAAWPWLVVAPLLFYLGAKVSLAFAMFPEALFVLWIPNGILLAGMFRLRWRYYGVFVALIVLAEIAADYPTFTIREAVLFGAINVLEVTLAYALLRNWDFDPRFSAPVDLAKFVVGGPLIAGFIAAAAAAATYMAFRGAPGGYLETVRVWWFSNGLGLLIVTPLAVTFCVPRAPSADVFPKLRWYDGAALVAAAGIVIPFALSQERMFYGFLVRPMLLIPPMVYVAARFGVRATSVFMIAFAALVLYVTKNGQHPFGRIDARETVIAVQELLFTMSAMSLGLSTLLSQHRRNRHELELRVAERTAALSAANEQLQTLAVTDPLTETLNRRALFALLHAELNRDQRYGHSLAVIVFDIDHFKRVNDRYGHVTGDAVLQHVARIAAAVIRRSDSIARYGGEEFVVVAPETDRFSALQLAERLRTTLRASTIEADGHTLSVTASFGVAVLRSASDTAEDLLRRADEALYSSKAAGRDRVTCAA